MTRSLPALIAELRRVAERGGSFSCSPLEASALLTKVHESVAYQARSAVEQTRAKDFEPWVCSVCLVPVLSTECPDAPHGDERDECCSCQEDAAESDEANRACDIARGA